MAAEATRQTSHGGSAGSACPRLSVLPALTHLRCGGDNFWNGSGTILKAVRGLMMIKVLTCTFSVAGAGFEPATSGL